MTLTATRPQMFIDGDRTDAASGETMAVINPATEEEIAQVPKGDASDVDRAVAAARAAFESWSQSTPQDRSKALFAFADAIEARRRDPLQPRAGERRQAEGHGRLRRRVHRRQHPILCGRRPGGRGQGSRRVHQHPHLDAPPRGRRRGGPGRAVELPADDGDLEALPGDRSGLHGGPEAGVDDAALRPPDRGARRGHLPEGRPQCRDRAWRGRRRSAHSSSGRRHGVPDRRHRDRQGDRRRRCSDREAGAPRARWQGSRARLRRRRHGRARRDDQAGRLLQLGPGLHGRHAADRDGRRVRPGARGVGARRGVDQGRRPRLRSGARHGTDGEPGPAGARRRVRGPRAEAPAPRSPPAARRSGTAATSIGLRS